MSSSIAIPKRKQAVAPAEGSDDSSSSHSSAYSFGSEMNSTPGTPPSNSLLSAKGKSKLPVGVAASPSSSSSEWISPRRPSLLGDSLSKSEYTVINLAHSDGPPRLVTCVKSSQGFDWNQELFLPSYADHDSHDLEHRPNPVEEIILTDEEAAAIMPQ